MKRKSSFVFAFGILAILTLLASGSIVLASPITNTGNSNSTKALPNFVENILEQLHPNATDAELNQIRTQWANQIELSQQHAPNAAQSLSPMMTPGVGGSYLTNPVGTECILGGYIQGQPSVMTGTSDGVMVVQNTPGYGDRTNIYGPMSSSNAGGYVYARGCLTPWSSYGNYLMVFATNDINNPDPNSWTFINYAQFSGLTPYWNYIGYTGSAFRYWNFGCWAAGGSDPTNVIAIDCVWTSNS